jgi:hypothetical protein
VERLDEMSDPNISLDGEGAKPRPTLPPTQANAPDPSNVDDLVVSQDYVQCSGPKQQLTIPKHKPDPKVYFRICPNPEYQKPFSILQFKDDNELSS